MEYLKPSILNLLYEESLRNFDRTISLEVFSERHDIDFQKLLHYVNALENQGILQRQTTPYGPKRILFDVRRKNNNPRAPKGSEYLYTVNGEKLKELIEKNCLSA